MTTWRAREVSCMWWWWGAGVNTNVPRFKPLRSSNDPRRKGSAVQSGSHCMRWWWGAGINFILSSMVFNVVPTALEVTLVAAILAWKCGPALAGLTGATLAAYVAFTFAVTQVSAIPQAPSPPLCHVAVSLLPH